MKKKILYVVGASVAVLLLLVGGVAIARSKAEAKETKRIKKVEKTLVEMIDNQVTTEADQELINEFVDLVNDLERTKATLYTHEGITYVLVSYYYEEGGVSGEVFDIEEIKDIIDEVRKES